MRGSASTISQGDEAERSPEWKDGVGRVWDAERGAPEDVRAALAPWLNVIRGMNAGGLRHYPGSPLHRLAHDAAGRCAAAVRAA